VRIDIPALRRRAEAVLEGLRSREDSVEIALIGNRAMRTLNKRFRGLDETTDVLAFPSAFSGQGALPAGIREEMLPAGEARPLGEVVISVDEARRQAGEDGSTLEAALDRLMIHGILHLKGFDHHAPAEAARMRRKERRLQEVLRGLRAGERRAGRRRGGGGPGRS